jgi:hypothetical protein
MMEIFIKGPPLKAHLTWAGQRKACCQGASRPMIYNFSTSRRASSWRKKGGLTKRAHLCLHRHDSAQPHGNTNSYFKANATSTTSRLLRRETSSISLLLSPCHERNGSNATRDQWQIREYPRRLRQSPSRSALGIDLE